MSKDASMDVLERLTGIVAMTLRLPSGQLDTDMEMIRLGIDSIIAMELIDAITHEFSVSLAPAQFASLGTLRELAELLQAHAPQAAGTTEATAVAAVPAAQADALLAFVNHTYAIDLSGGEFGSLDELADTLVQGHADKLMHHYRLAPEEESASAAPDVALVGLSCRLADAPNVRTFWANLLAGRNSVREIPASRWRWQEHFDDTAAPGKSVSKWGALVDGVDCFDAAFFGIDAAEADAMDPQQRLLLQETWHALEDAGVDPRSLAGSRTGVFVGYQYSEYEHYLRRFNFQRSADGPVFSSSSPTYYLANRISFAFDLRGPSEAINVNCASSAVAINRAWNALANGECDMAIAAGVSLNLFAGDYIVSSQYGLLSPDGTSGVFDNAACGYTRGEGIGVLVMKRGAVARRERSRIYALLKGCHQNYRGAARSLSEVRYEPITDVLASCYRRASIEPASVRYIEVDGYATKWADAFEYEGIKGAIPCDAPGTKRCALGSVKGNLGNLEAASGVVSVIKVALSLHHQRFPTTLTTRAISSFIDIDSDAHSLYIAGEPIGFETIREDDAPVRAGVNSFADSGTNVHIVLEEQRAAHPQPSAAEPAARLFVLSARDPERLGEYIQEYIAFLEGGTEPVSFEDLIYTVQTGRTAFEARLAVLAGSQEALRGKLARVIAAGLHEPLGLDAAGIYYGPPAAAGANRLAGLIGEDVARMQLEQAARSSQWEAVAQLWVNGVAMPWHTLWVASCARPVTLPGYPFERTRHWIDAEGTPAHAAPPAVPVQADAPRGISPVVTDPRSKETFPRAPVRALERFLQQIVARHLGQPAHAVPTDRGFIELGLNSIALAELIQRVGAALGVGFGPATVFRHPRIDVLAAHLVESYPEATGARVAVLTAAAAMRPEGGGAQAASDAPGEPVPPESLVALRADGAAPPIFALPGAGGSALSLQQLSHAFGNSQPFYCIEPVGLDGRTPPLTRIEAIAELNVAWLRSARPHGPYRLLGYSNGGVVAFEMARQLAACGAPAATLVLLDTLCPTLREDDLSEMTAAVFRNFVHSLGASTELDARQLRLVPEEARSGYLHDLLCALDVSVPRAQFMATFQVATASELACRAYLPQVLPRDTATLLVRAREGFTGAPPDYGWRAFLAGGLQVHEIDADHFTLLEAGPATALAALIGTSGASDDEPVNQPAAAGELAVNE